MVSRNFYEYTHFRTIEMTKMLLPPQQPSAWKQPLTGFVLKCSTASIGYYVATSLAWLIFVVTMPFSLFFCIKIVHEYKRMVVFRLGRLLKQAPLGPGVVIILPCIDTHTLVDLRTTSYDVPSQEMLTKDSVTVSVDAAVYFRTSDPVATIAAAVDSCLSTKQLAQTTLRNVLGTKSLSEIMSAREEVALEAQEILDPTAARWGIKVERVEVKDIRLPRELCRVLAREAKATREADAKIVSATGELNALIALRHAADKISDSPIAIQLRYLQTLVKISTTQNHTIVVPIPMEFIKAAMRHLEKDKKNIKQSWPSSNNT